MSTESWSHQGLITQLCAPFDERQVRTRTQAGRQLSYITARSAQNRLDEVFPLAWGCEYFETEKGLRCRITVTLPDGSKVVREDGGAAAGMSEADNDEKSAYSDAFKRAAVQFGIARYLYKDGVPDFAMAEHGEVPQPRPAQQQQRRADPPRQQVPPPQRPQGGQAGGDSDRAPTSGRALFAWTKKQEEVHGTGLLDYLNEWGKHQDPKMPFKMIDWTQDDVRDAHRAALLAIETKTSGEPQMAGVAQADSQDEDDIPF